MQWDAWQSLSTCDPRKRRVMMWHVVSTKLNWVSKCTRLRHGLVYFRPVEYGSAISRLNQCSALFLSSRHISKLHRSCKWRGHGPKSTMRQLTLVLNHEPTTRKARQTMSSTTLSSPKISRWERGNRLHTPALYLHSNPSVFLRRHRFHPVLFWGNFVPRFHSTCTVQHF